MAYVEYNIQNGSGRCQPGLTFVVNGYQGGAEPSRGPNGWVPPTARYVLPNTRITFGNCANTACLAPCEPAYHPSDTYGFTVAPGLRVIGWGWCLAKTGLSGGLPSVLLEPAVSEEGSLALAIANLNYDEEAVALVETSYAFHDPKLTPDELHDLLPEGSWTGRRHMPQREDIDWQPLEQLPGFPRGRAPEFPGLDPEYYRRWRVPELLFGEYTVIALPAITQTAGLLLLGFVRERGHVEVTWLYQLTVEDIQTTG